MIFRIERYAFFFGGGGGGGRSENGFVISDYLDSSPPKKKRKILERIRICHDDAVRMADKNELLIIQIGDNQAGIFVSKLFKCRHHDHSFCKLSFSCNLHRNITLTTSTSACSRNSATRFTSNYRNCCVLLSHGKPLVKNTCFESFHRKRHR